MTELSFADVPDSRRRVFIRQKPSFVMVWAATSKNMEVSKETMVPGSLSAFLEQGGLAALITRPEGDGLLCLVPFRGRYCASHGLIEALKRSLVTAWTKMPQETLRKAAAGFRSKLKRVIQAKGGHIE